MLDTCQARDSYTFAICSKLVENDESKRLGYQETTKKLGRLRVDLSSDAKIADCIENYRAEDRASQTKRKLVLAEGCQKLYKYTDALTHYEEVLKMLDSQMQESGEFCEEDRAEALYNMGKIYDILNQQPIAKKCFEEALALRSALHGEDSMECCEVLN